MATVFFLDVPENRPVVAVAERDPLVRVGRLGPYFEVCSESPIEIDRRSTGCRHAVWYSCVAGLDGFQIVGWDKDSLRLAVER